MQTDTKTLVTNLLFSIGTNVSSSYELDEVVTFYSKLIEYTDTIMNESLHKSYYFSFTNNYNNIDPQYVRIGSINNESSLALKVTILDPKFTGSVIYDLSETQLINMKANDILNIIKSQSSK